MSRLLSAHMLPQQDSIEIPGCQECPSQLVVVLDPGPDEVICPSSSSLAACAKCSPRSSAPPSPRSWEATCSSSAPRALPAEAAARAVHRAQQTDVEDSPGRQALRQQLAELEEQMAKLREQMEQQKEQTDKMREEHEEERRWLIQEKTQAVERCAAEQARCRELQQQLDKHARRASPRLETPQRPRADGARDRSRTSAVDQLALQALQARGGWDKRPYYRKRRPRPCAPSHAGKSAVGRLSLDFNGRDHDFHRRTVDATTTESEPARTVQRRVAHQVHRAPRWAASGTPPEEVSTAAESAAHDRDYRCVEADFDIPVSSDS
eukprot:TRINITY_DN952_c1_g1_i1.p1 TRINITY_DN952_c1_g1~~TRINITY_DN952_c1_g1_i1.p1  ORF type:complete len:342 (+),score=58.43 TRINITY_DN952_c1_g1_i1:61-1026(+)